MKNFSYTLLLAIVFILTSVVLRAQSGYKTQDLPVNSLSCGFGLITVDEVRGLSNGPLYDYMSFPGIVTTALFVNYHHYFSRRASIGVTLGLDNQNGELSYGNPEWGAHIGNGGGTSGHYSRQYYTLAVEGKFAYLRHNRFSIYGLAGVGYTLGSVTYKFADDVTAPSYFYGPNGLVPTNPYKQNDSHINGQITPLGLRMGGQFAYFFELGMGYKGLMHMGISAEF